MSRPAGRSVARIRPGCLFVGANLPSDSGPSALRTVERCGLQAISFDSPPGLHDPGFTEWARGKITAARAVAKSVLIYGVASMRHASIAGMLQATHATLDEHTARE